MFACTATTRAALIERAQAEKAAALQPVQRPERHHLREVTGDPDVLLTFKGLQPETVAEGLERNPGVVVTANHCISAIPLVCEAGPGIKTYLDLPMITGRAAPHLAR